jgi:tetratricopeptide (TPR) repeat protein
MAMIKCSRQDRAIADYASAIAINPRYAAAYIDRGTAYQAKGNGDLAIADFTKAIEIARGLKCTNIAAMRTRPRASSIAPSLISTCTDVEGRLISVIDGPR